MNGVLSGFGASIFQAITGQDPNAIGAQLTQAEQQLTLAVEAVIALLFLIMVGQVFIVLELRRR
jgi:hypothetical protein